MTLSFAILPFSSTFSMPKNFCRALISAGSGSAAANADRTQRTLGKTADRNRMHFMAGAPLPLVSQIHSSLTPISLLVCLEILLHVIGRVFLREPALIHPLLQPVLDLADVLAVVLVELAEHFVREPCLVSGLVAKTGAAVGNGVRKQRHIQISRAHAALSVAELVQRHAGAVTQVVVDFHDRGRARRYRAARCPVDQVLQAHESHCAVGA